MLAKRVHEVDASGIRKVFYLAQDLKKPVNLRIGQPDFDIPTPVKEEAKLWIDKGFSKYTVTQGIPELREKVRKRYADDGIDPGDIFITSGTSGGLLLALMALVEPGDEQEELIRWLDDYKSRTDNKKQDKNSAVPETDEEGADEVVKAMLDAYDDGDWEKYASYYDLEFWAKTATEDKDFAAGRKGPWAVEEAKETIIKLHKRDDHQITYKILRIKPGRSGETIVRVKIDDDVVDFHMWKVNDKWKRR